MIGENITKQYGSRFYYNKLNSNDKSIYNLIIDTIKQLKKTVKLKSTLIVNKNNINRILEYINYDNPDIFYLDINKCYTTVTLMSKSLNIEYMYNTSKIKEIQKKLEDIANQIIKSKINKYQTEYEIVLNLHNFLSESIIYDKSTLASMRGEKLHNRSESHSIVGALINRKCVCEGFAKAMHMLCSMVGIESMYVVGDGQIRGVKERHAWNIVKINGYYHHVDVTWDSQFIEDEKIPFYSYLNLSDKSISKDHKWDRELYPECKEEPYNYFKINSAFIASKVQLEKLIYENILNEEEFIIFKLSEKAYIQNNDEQYIYESINSAMNKCKYKGGINYHIHYIEQQQTYTLKMNYN